MDLIDAILHYTYFRLAVDEFARDERVRKAATVCRMPLKEFVRQCLTTAILMLQGKEESNSPEVAMYGRPAGMLLGLVESKMGPITSYDWLTNSEMDALLSRVN